MKHLLVLLLLSVVTPGTPTAFVQWQTDGVPVCTAPRDQEVPVVVPDGAGGVIIAWLDNRDGSETSIYAQRLNASGIPQWTADGILVHTAPDWHGQPTIVSDGTGGALVAWVSSGILYAQRIDASGVSQWADNGAVVAAGIYQVMVADGAGGTILAWVNGGIHAQRIDAAGAPQWDAGGIPVCAPAQPLSMLAMVPDGASGAVITWRDQRTTTNRWSVYVQRVSQTGALPWGTDGVLVRDAVIATATGPGIAEDGSGGAIIAWGEAGPPYLLVQRVNGMGALEWAEDGVAVSATAQSWPSIVSDGLGGAIVAWQDIRVFPERDIYAQHLNTQGATLWAQDGLPICTASGEQTGPSVTADGLGGAIVAWSDFRDGPDFDIYAQRVTSCGFPQWQDDGVAVCTATGDQYHSGVCSDAEGKAFFAWADYRNGLLSDIYAQCVGGALPVAVAISSFDATSADGAVTLRGTFRSDLGVGSVNVYRGCLGCGDHLVRIDTEHGVRGHTFQYVDRAVTPGQTYSYQIGVNDSDGELLSPVVTVAVEMITCGLAQNHPNPFNPTTTIRFILPVREGVTLSIHDAQGRLVRTLVNEVQGFGAHEVTWDGRNNGGAVTGSGVYFYRLRAGKQTLTKKMVLLK